MIGTRIFSEQLPANSGALYRLLFSSGKSYIGVTEVSPIARFKSHKRKSREGSTHLVHSAWRRHGEPTLIVLAVVDKKILLDTERAAVKVFCSLNPGGYNMTPGGEHPPMLGRHHSFETRSKMSLAKTGRPLSDAAKASFSLAQKNSIKARVNVMRMSAANVGSKRTLEQRVRMSLALRGRKMPDDFGERIRKSITPERIAAFRKRTSGENSPSKRPEVRAKIAAANTGKKHSSQTKIKMSVSAVIGWEKRRQSSVCL